MRALIQRVTEASVTSNGEQLGRIDQGLCVLLGVTHDDTETTAHKMAEKLWNLRIFEDENGAINLSAADKHAPILLISQFTLYGDTSKGRRPSFITAARPETAEPLIETTITELRSLGAHVETGRFRTNMQVSLVNDGPTTLIIDV